MTASAKLVLTRDVPRAECQWLDRDMKRGETVYRYNGCTYGCIAGGVACTENPGQTPFFELPIDAFRT